MADEYELFLDELQKRNGLDASNRESDLAKLRSTNPGDDMQRVQDALSSQYQRRAGSQTTGSGMDSSEASAMGYGSGRGETADDRGGASRSGGGGGGGSVTNSWLQHSAPDPRGNAFYDQLLQRSQQSLAVDGSDPVIRAQTDAYAANRERTRRNYVSDEAERGGPYANMLGTSRASAERAGQDVAGFQAELMGRELAARREEIAQALMLMGGRLSDEERLALTRELGMIDANLRQQGIGLQGRGLDMQNDQFLQELAERQYQYDNPWF